MTIVFPLAFPVAVSPTLTSLSLPIRTGVPAGAEAPAGPMAAGLCEGATEQADRANAPPAVAPAPSSMDVGAVTFQGSWSHHANFP